MRPHDIEVHKERNGEQSFEAHVSYIHAIGPLVRLELQRLSNGLVGAESLEAEPIQAELTQERFRELNISQGERVFVTPRNVRVFLSPV